MDHASTDRLILVVDDDDLIRDLLRALLQEEGYAVATAANGRAALDQLAAGLRPCLIILDWMMPGMGGAEFRAEQRRRPDLARIPVLVITAAHASQVDADVVLGMPLCLDQLTATFAQHCGGVSAATTSASDGL